MIFVDTGYLWALLDEGDELHPRAVAWQAALRESLLTTEYVIWELINAFSAPENRLKVHEALDVLRSSSAWQLIASTGDLFEAGLRMHRSHSDKSWSLTDCISIRIMREREMTRALTFDHHFEQAGFEALLRRDPL
jgi:uncharacterized protein